VGYQRVVQEALKHTTKGALSSCDQNHLFRSLNLSLSLPLHYLGFAQMMLSWYSWIAWSLSETEIGRPKSHQFLSPTLPRLAKSKAQVRSEERWDGWGCGERFPRYGRNHVPESERTYVGI